jgi:hypothetical protein
MIGKDRGTRMSRGRVSVLLVGESARGFSFLLEHLEKRGCDCFVAASGSEAARLCAGRIFDLVLCTDRIESTSTLIASLIGSRTTLFCSHPVEDSCWWLPAVRAGKKCLGTPALRPSEFANILDKMVDKIKSGEHPPREFAPRGAAVPGI